ncbi:MAG: Asp-tRNA(Asn)/Glu-tRNA(Gln) amidotransferase subunit GatA [Bacteroidetes bacterium]|nr:Asp-tRNA(Asn)/Glu-tRNA(Gln) amidotransferase subunit GatA [Bacteroidota bacterium]
MYLFSNIDQLRSDLTTKKISCVDLVNQSILEIRKQQHLNAFLEIFEKSALETAKRVDEKITKNQAIGKLAGTIIGIKDNICYKHHKVSASSKILEGFESLYSATAVEKLLAEDAIIIGRLNCDEFAMGSSNENSAFGKVLNPLNPHCVPGGSSGGSAAAVAANLCHVALGSDTGGSIRQPASFTGTVGLKPTYGRVSRYGLIAYASSFDQIGPITKTVTDASIVLGVINGLDAHDNTSSSEPAYTHKNFTKKKYKIAVLGDCINAKGLDAEVKLAVSEALNVLKTKGHTITEVNFPYLDYLVPTYYVLTTAEASSNLARFTGIHYGYRSSNGKDLESTYKKTRGEGFGKEVKRRIMLGTFVLSAGYYDAYYAKAQKVRRVIQNKTFDLLKEYDIIVTPSTPGTAFEFGKNSTDPIKMYLEDIFTVQANIAGVPAISVPCGKHSNGLPMGIQFMANYFEEEKLFDVSSQL